MKLSSAELKRRARAALTGHYGLPMLSFILIELIVLLLQIPFRPPLTNPPDILQTVIYILASLIISLLSALLNCGMLYIHLQLAEGEKARLLDVFRYFNKRPDRIILSALLMECITGAVMLPAILSVFAFLNNKLSYLFAGLIWIITAVLITVLSLMYEMIYFLLIEQPEAGTLHVFRESRRLMRGNKARKFYINISFLGLGVLSILSFGIGLLWVIPYMNQTNAAFFRDVNKITVPLPPSPLFDAKV